MRRAPHSGALAVSVGALALLAAWDVAPLVRGSHHFSLPAGAYLGLLAIHMLGTLALLWITTEDELRECAVHGVTVACQPTRNAREFVQLQSVSTGLVLLLAGTNVLGGGQVVTRVLVQYALCVAALGNAVWFLYIHVPRYAVRTATV